MNPRLEKHGLFVSQRVEALASAALSHPAWPDPAVGQITLHELE